MTDEWHILTRTQEGVVSLLKSLSENIARQTMQKLEQWGGPWCDQTIAEQLAHDEAIRKYNAAVAVGTPVTTNGMGMMYAGRHFQHIYIPEEPSEQSGFVQLECWGPDGAELEVWPKPDDYDARLAKATEAHETNMAATRKAEAEAANINDQIARRA